MRTTLFLLLVSALLLVTSCETTRKTMASPDRPLQTLEWDNIAVTLRYMDESELNSRFRSDFNPFLSTYHQAMFQRIIVFELTIINDSGFDYSFTTDNVLYHIGSKVVRADTPFKLINYWEAVDTDPRNSGRREDIIRRHMIEEYETAAAGRSLQGYLVFRGTNLPLEGEGHVRIAGSIGDPFEFEYSFFYD
jgi:hypothetical protein